MSGGVFKVITPVIVEPIALPDAKAWMRIDFADDDPLITSLISRARSFAETVTGRALATQQVQEVFTIERPKGGEVSGPISHGPNWYQYQEQLGANPFGAAQFYFDLAMPPIQQSTGITVETKITAFDPWLPFTGQTYVDDNQEPARMYFMDPITANFWRFTYWCGYSSTYPIPPDLQHYLYEAVAHFYDNREAEGVPQDLLNKLMSKRVSWI